MGPTEHSGLPGPLELGLVTPHSPKPCSYKLCLSGAQDPAHGPPEPAEEPPLLILPGPEPAAALEPGNSSESGASKSREGR